MSFMQKKTTLCAFDAPKKAGAAFIKWGQWAATWPDLFPKDLCAELEKLHSNAPAHKFSYTLKSIERAFGKTLHEIFMDFEEKPVASRSIAQVYKATLQDGVAFGRQKGPMTVAVKVQHLGVTDVSRKLAYIGTNTILKMLLVDNFIHADVHPGNILLETSFKFWGSKEAKVIRLGECMQDVLEQVRIHRVNIDGDVCTVMVTMMVLEGWQCKLDPNFNKMHSSKAAESLAYTINAVMAP
ncbi:hypothetical protein GOP47_0029257 [Adiantum capillus-veneris]|nr:hypothetical protein GOP47_0029257 [Adiantum capillus-veneris]